MLSQLACNLRKDSISLILTPTRLEDKFKKNKINLEIFKDLKAGEKLGKIIDEEGQSKYYKVGHYLGIQVSRWWYGEGRKKTVEYLNEDFINFMKFLDDLLKNLELS